MNSTRTESGRIRNWLLLTILVWVVIESAVAFSFRHEASPGRLLLDPGPYRPLITELLKQRPETNPRLCFDPVLGLAPRPGYRSDREGFAAIHNRQGLRNLKDFDKYPRSEILRIACFGDSFTYCDDVADQASWPQMLEESLPGCEVLNFGVSGYGTDQAVLRSIRDGRRFHPRIAVLGLLHENLARLLTRYRPFYGAWLGVRDDLIYPKPRFLLENGELTLIPQPLRQFSGISQVLEPAFLAELGRNDYYFQRIRSLDSALSLPAVTPLLRQIRAMRLHRACQSPEEQDRQETEAMQIFRPLLVRWIRRMRQDGIQPVLLLHADRGRLEVNAQYLFYSCNIFEESLAEIAATEKTPLLRALDVLGPALRESTPAELVPGHYSPLANRLLADHLAKHLQTLLPGNHPPLPH